MFSIAFLIAVFLFPSRGHLRLEYVLVVLLLIGVLLRGDLSPFSKVRRELYFLAFLTIGGLVSILFHVASGGTFDYRDLMSIVRYPVYGAILVSVIVAAPRTERSREATGMTIGFIAIAVGIISLLQHYDVGGIDSLLRTVYSTTAIGGADEPEIGSLAAGRLTGTSGNPNWWGFTIVSLFLMLTARAVTTKRLLWIPVLLLLVTSLILTGSRTAVVAALFGAGLITILGFKSGSTGIGRSMVIALFAVLVIGWGVFYQLNLAADANRFSIERMGSFLIRIEVWSATLDEYQNDIVLGRGPAKLDRVAGFRDASSFHVRDNIYIAFLAQFGIVGLVGFLGFSLTQIIKLFSLTRRANPPDRWWPIGMLGTMAAWMLFGVAGDSFFFVPASTILLVLYGTALVAGEPEVATLKGRGPGPTDAYDPTFEFPE